MAPPETTVCPCMATSWAISPATCLPYSFTPRDPTTATGDEHAASACRSPMPHKHNGGAQSERTAKSPRRSGHRSSPGITTHCVPACVIHAVNASYSHVGRDCKRARQRVRARWKACNPWGFTWQPHRAAPWLNRWSNARSAWRRSASSWPSRPSTSRVNTASACGAPLSSAIISASAPSMQYVSRHLAMRSPQRSTSRACAAAPLMSTPWCAGQSPGPYGPRSARRNRRGHTVSMPNASNGPRRAGSTVARQAPH